MRQFTFEAKSGMDDELVKILDALNDEEQNSLIRKALHSYIKTIPLKERKGRTTKQYIRPEPHGYPVD